MEKRLLIGVVLLLFCFQASAQVRPGAVMSWITIEAEDMHTNGILLQQSTVPHLVETESSGRSAVRLETKEHFIETIAPVFSNTLVIRYNLPDNANGKGLSSSLDILVNGKTMKHCGISSYNTWLYGDYPFSNVPHTGKPRQFYDELINIGKGDIVQIRRGNAQDDNAAYCIIDSIRHCLFTDVTQGAGILISTTFPTENQSRGINNNFSGTTMVDFCVIENSGGSDHEWDWRGAKKVYQMPFVSFQKIQTKKKEYCNRPN